MKIFIIYHKIFDFDGNILSIGGIQTYILNLSKMLLNNGFTPVIYQLANKPWIIEHNGIKFHGVQKLQTKDSLKQSSRILKEIEKEYTDNDLVIWANDNIAVENSAFNTLLIQHGIGFDFIPKDTKIIQFLHYVQWQPLYKLSRFYKLLQCRRSIQSFVKAKHKICVDYNYLNWIRTMLPREELDHINVIPNFTHINQKVNINFQDNDRIKILFARRFTEERGAHILVNIIDELSKKYNNIDFTIAGEGPYGELFQTKYAKSSHIEITKYFHEESLEIHSRHHIAIIPTYGSEGTSLSLLEAMTSGCVPIASNIGGMTNIVLDNYNGFLVDPIANAFIDKLSYLIENHERRKTFSENAKRSADSAFSYALWEKRWLDVLNHEIKVN
jgi:glycosyltransferase involved in cell wall biosynthesis